MMNKMKITLLLLVSIISSGCATTQSSDAKKIANYGGIDQIRDAKVPKDTEVALTDSKTYQTAFNAMGTGVVTGNGLTLDNVGIGLAMTMLSPRSDAARNSVFSFTPANEVKGDLLHFTHGQYEQSFKVLAKKENFNVATVIDRKYDKDWFAEKLLSAFIFQKPEIGCPIYDPDKAAGKAKEYCYFGIETYISDDHREVKDGPEELSALGLETKSVYRVDAGLEYHYSSVYINRPKTAIFNDLDVFEEISRNLPSYSFVYIAPKGAQLSQDREDLLTFPILFRSGEPMFFVVPEAE